MKNEWHKNWTKLPTGILLVYIFKYFGRINITKVKHPIPFSFPVWSEVELMNVFKCLAKSLIFYYFICSKNFLKWASFGYRRNICTQLHIANYVSTLCLDLSIYIICIYLLYICNVCAVMVQNLDRATSIRV